jgi:hypothetical protein
MNTDRKFTKFGRHIAGYKKAPNNVWNYVAYDSQHNTCIVIQMMHSYDCDLKYLIDVRHGDAFDLSGKLSEITFEEVTEQEFWAAYKMAVVNQLELYYSHNPKK